MNPMFDPSQLPLRDIHLPAAIAWWPPALGWWLLAAALIAVIWLALRYWQRHGPQRAALSALARIAAALRRGENPVLCLQEASSVLRRFAMTAAADPAAVAGLCGERWLAFLDSHWQRGGFVDGAGRRLVTAPYQPPALVTASEALELSTLCANWVRAQRPRS